MTALYVLLGALAIVAVFLIGIYNSLVSKKQRCNQAFADIDVQLKQRQNLIPNLVETVKGYASHERETLEEVIQARNSAVAAGTPGEMAQAEGVLTSALGKLFALSEAYPDLKANENFKDLQDELSVIEDKRPPGKACGGRLATEAVRTDACPPSRASRRSSVSERPSCKSKTRPITMMRASGVV